MSPNVVMEQDSSPQPALEEEEEKEEAEEEDSIRSCSVLCLEGNLLRLEQV